MIDVLATEPHFVDHLAAVWHALPAGARGDFIVPSMLRDRAKARGVASPGPNAQDARLPILVAAYGDQKRARRMGRTRIAYIEHGAGQAYPADRKWFNHPTYAGGRELFWTEAPKPESESEPPPARS